MPRTTPAHNPEHRALTKPERLAEMIEHLRKLTRSGVFYWDIDYIDFKTKIFLSRLCTATNIRTEELERLRKIREKLV